MKIKLNKLKKSLKNIALLEGMENLLHWDLETNLPKGAIENRAEQAELISTLVHKAYTQKKLKNQLHEFIEFKSGKIIAKNLNKVENRLLEVTYKDWRKKNSLPASFVKNFARSTTKAQFAWEQARKENDFTIFSPYLAKLIKLAKKKADYFNWQTTRYDALLDEFEPETTTKMLNPIFDNLKIEIKNLLKKLQETKKFSAPFPNLKFNEQQQEIFAKKLLKAMNFDFDCGRLDISTHPFTSNFHTTDVRLTTKYLADNLMMALSSTMHEGGHGLYEQNMNPDFAYTPLLQAPSFGIHESQSRLWEILVGLSFDFWQGFYPDLQKIFPAELGQIELADFYQYINQVKPSLIRIEADELTYNLHIIIRFELEQMMINDKIEVQDLPDLWNQKYQDYLGVKPKKLSEGILQDVHWSCGYFGYFPSYTLGNLYSAQIFATAKKEIPNLKASLAEKSLIPLFAWLKTKVYQQARLYSAKELIHLITDEELTPDYFTAHLKEKYL